MPTKNPTNPPTPSPSTFPSPSPSKPPTKSPTKRPTQPCLGLRIDGGHESKLNGLYHKLGDMKNGHYQWGKRVKTGQGKTTIYYDNFRKTWVIKGPAFILELPGLTGFYQPLTSVDVKFLNVDYTLRIYCEDTKHPTRSPTKEPTPSPTSDPTKSPTKPPTKYPTKKPTNEPTPSPTTKPTKMPTKPPTKRPTRSPSKMPTLPPSNEPTRTPTSAPTEPCIGLRIDHDGGASELKGKYYKLLTLKNGQHQWEKLVSGDKGAITLYFDKDKKDWVISGPSFTVTIPGLSKMIVFNDKLTRVPNVVFMNKLYDLRIWCSDTKHPTISPTNEPTPNPTSDPTRYPTNLPTSSPTEKPTDGPSKYPTPSPTNVPTKIPTKPPTVSPSTYPTSSPTKPPTMSPTTRPTEPCLGLRIEGGPKILNGIYHKLLGEINGKAQWEKRASGLQPKIVIFYNGNDWVIYSTNSFTVVLKGLSAYYEPLTKIPNIKFKDDPDRYVLYIHCHDTKHPTLLPTKEPTPSPTTYPTKEPTKDPTKTPTKPPTSSPTYVPTKSPTKEPTYEPTGKPTASPTEEPTPGPTMYPTKTPTKRPTEPCYGLRVEGGGKKIDGVYHRLPNDISGRHQWEKRVSASTPAIRIYFDGTDWVIKQFTSGGFILKLVGLSALYEPITILKDIQFDGQTRTLKLHCEDTKHPTISPSKKPTKPPTPSPTSYPTKYPTKLPTKPPTKIPTKPPTTSPSHVPTKSPTGKPTASPTEEPTPGPTMKPTVTPTTSPTEPCFGLKIEGGPKIINGVYFKLPYLANGRFQWEKRVSASEEPNTLYFDGKDWVIKGPSTGGKEFKLVLPNLSGFYEPLETVPNIFWMGEPKPYILRLHCEDTKHPTVSPSKKPTKPPTPSPTKVPTKKPTTKPTMTPTSPPTTNPTSDPTKYPTKAPTKQPTEPCFGLVVEKGPEKFNGIYFKLPNLKNGQFQWEKRIDKTIGATTVYFDGTVWVIEGPDGKLVLKGLKAFYGEHTVVKDVLYADVPYNMELHCHDTSHPTRSPSTSPSKEPTKPPTRSPTPPHICDCEKVDAVFVLDYSAAVCLDAWRVEIDFVIRMVKDHLPKESRVAVILFDYRVRIWFGFDCFTQTTRSVIEKLLEIRDLPPSPKKQLTSYADEGVKAALGLFEKTPNTRGKLMFFISNSAPATDHYPCALKSKLDEYKVNLILFGVGKIDLTNLKCLIPQERRSTHVFTYETFKSLDACQDWSSITTAICICKDVGCASWSKWTDCNSGQRTRSRTCSQTSYLPYSRASATALITSHAQQCAITPDLFEICAPGCEEYFDGCNTCTCSSSSSSGGQCGYTTCKKTNICWTYQPARCIKFTKGGETKETTEKPPPPGYKKEREEVVTKDVGTSDTSGMVVDESTPYTWSVNHVSYGALFLCVGVFGTLYVIRKQHKSLSTTKSIDYEQIPDEDDSFMSTSQYLST